MHGRGRLKSQVQQNLVGTCGRILWLDGQCAGSLGQLLSSGVDDDGHVEILRCRLAQGLLLIDMQPRRVEQIYPAHDVCDALSRIVQHHGEMIGRQPIATEYYIISRTRVDIIPACSLQPVVKTAC